MKTLRTSISAALLLAAPLCAQEPSAQTLPPPPPAPPGAPQEAEPRPPLPPPGPGTPADLHERDAHGPDDRAGHEHEPGKLPPPPLPPRDGERGGGGPRGERPDRRDGPPGMRGERRFDDRAPRGEGDRREGDRRDGEQRRDGGRQFETERRLYALPRPGDGPRMERGPRDGEPDAPERRLKPTPYIGVVTSPVAPALATQLGLGEGFGVVVDEVVPDSPAKAAGIERYDVLKQLNDQQLVDPSQLATLLRAIGKDKEAALTIIRKGQEQKVTVKIGEKMLPDRDSGDRHDGFNFFRRYLNEDRRLPQIRPSDRPEFPGEPDAPGGVSPSDFFREIRPGAPGAPRAEWRDGTSRWNANRARLTLRDPDGEIEVTVNDGHRVLTARGASGDTVFTGPVDTERERQAVPEPFRQKLATFDAPRSLSGPRPEVPPRPAAPPAPPAQDLQ